MNVRRTQSLLNAEQMKAVIEKLRGGLIVSCQAPAGSPLDDAEIIAAFALTAEQQGAVGVRLNARGTSWRRGDGSPCRSSAWRKS
jgi:hypothetical protein